MPYVFIVHKGCLVVFTEMTVPGQKVLLSPSLLNQEVQKGSLLICLSVKVMDLVSCKL
jgi:hypothetical protein